MNEFSKSCIAGYEWFKQRGQNNEKLDPLADERFTFINGRLVIDSPSTAREDDGRYQCAAENKYGKILSNQVELAFGCKNHFSCIRFITLLTRFSCH